MRFALQCHSVFGGWEFVGRDCDTDELETFATRADAEAELTNELATQEQAGLAPNRSEWRVAEVPNA